MIKRVSFFEIDFHICSDARTHPEHVLDFTGYFKGRCYVISCKQSPSLNGCFVQLEAKQLLSLNTGWCYYSNAATYDNAKGSLLITDQVDCTRLKDRFNTADLQSILSEWHTVSEAPSKQHKKKKKEDDDELSPQIKYMKEIGAAGSISSAEFMRAPVLEDVLREQSDLVRLPYIQRLVRYLPKDSIARVRKLATEKLMALDVLLQTTPWELVFREPLHSEYGKIKCVPEEKYQSLLARYKVTPPTHIDYAVRIYFMVQRNVEESKHTLFDRQPYATQMIPITVRAQLEPLVFGYLEERAIVWADAQHSKFALQEDFLDAKAVCRSLYTIHFNAAHGAPAVRDVMYGVPCIPPTLTADQTVIAKHILREPVTVVEGLPGTGKTAIITWAVSHFAAVMLLSLTCTMVKSLQMRNGGHTEAANTIHYVIHHANDKYAREWLAEFEVLIVDEASNVDNRLLGKLMRLLPNLKRFVLVGDYRQKRPIRAGFPLGDMRDSFPLFVLTEILRVDPKLRDLAMAPKLIIQECERNDGCKQLGFTAHGPLRLVPKVLMDNGQEDYVRTLRPILESFIKKDRSLMNHHVVVLQHTHRVKVNAACQQIFKEMKLGKKGSRAYINGKEFYVGCKITFTKNYNKLAVHGARRSCPVANGELAIIAKLKRFDKGIYLTIVDSDDPAEATTKTVIVSNVLEGAVSMNHLDLGYATTTMSVQGKEFARVAFWNNTAPNAYWFRSDAYVASSRGKQECVVIGSRRDFDSICMNVDRHRRTVLRAAFEDALGELTKYKAIPCDEHIHDPATLAVSTALCTPTLASITKRERRARKEKEEENDEDVD